MGGGGGALRRRPRNDELERKPVVGERSLSLSLSRGRGDRQLVGGGGTRVMYRRPDAEELRLAPRGHQ